MGILSGLEPHRVFEIFEQISAVPRGSGHTEKISEFIASFAEKRNLTFVRDAKGNVVIFKNGSAGREGEAPVILQGHMDMVWESVNNFDFEHNGLKLMIDGDYITADGTTLGGDDGIAVAMCLAVIDDDSLSHPPIEAVFTVDEETGMYGAEFLDTSVLRGRRMINLDSESEDVLWVSCAGGLRADIDLPLVRVKASVPAYKIKISGLHGGHSGSEIHKSYANATILMGRLLKEISVSYDISIADIQGGRMDNAITRECRAVICTAGNIENIVKDFEDRIKKEYSVSDPGITITLEKAGTDTCFDKKTSDAALKLLSSLPYGVIKMSSVMEGLVQTSLNPGIALTGKEKLTIGYSIRSSVNEERDALSSEVTELGESCGAKVTLHSRYPAWEYRENSPLRDAMAEAYLKLYGRKPDITAIHAGLECGLFSGKMEGLDCVSIGPDMLDIHTPDEKLSIPSSARIYALVTEVLENI